MGRVNYRETTTIPGGVGGTLFPLEGIAHVPFIVNPDGTEGAQANAYEDRTSSTAAPSLDTDSSGSISYWLDAGDYNIHVSDQQSPPRIPADIRGFTAPIIDTNQLVQSAQNLIQFSGDTKFSHQIADHGLKTDGTYEWLLMNSDPDGGGRRISHTAYGALWQLLGAPTPDSSGNFRLPNISGRALIAVGAATGLTVRNLFDSFGVETHALSPTESGVNPNGITADDSPDHTHSGTTGGQSADHGHNMSSPAHNVPTTDLGWTGNGVTPGSGYEVPTTNGTIGASSVTAGTSNDHTHGFASSGASTRHQHLLNARTADAAHTNLQPSFGMNLFVKS